MRPTAKPELWVLCATRASGADGPDDMDDLIRLTRVQQVGQRLLELISLTVGQAWSPGQGFSSSWLISR